VWWYIPAHVTDCYLRDLAWEMGKSKKCSPCDGIETPWHVIGECPGTRKQAVEIRTDWANRMWKLVQKETIDSKRTAGNGRGEHVEANVECGGRKRSS
jgi:hypothetical protein